MKSVAGGLRLDLAQYREMEAFAQFGSDLDASTQRLLARGERTVEMLKQPQYAPMPVESQVVVIYAVTNGYLDDFPVGRVREWERDFLDYMAANKGDFMAALRAEQVLNEVLEGELKDTLDDFNLRFEVELGAGVPA